MNDSITFRPMRRFKQETSQEECFAILEKAPRGILSVLGDNGYPYGVPLNFFFHEGRIYFHCAMEGHKLDEGPTFLPGTGFRSG